MNQSLVRINIADVMAQAVATGLFVSRCTIQSPNGLLGASGAPSGTYATVAGLADIVCMDAPQPPSEIKLGAYEKKTMGEVLSVAIRHVLLDDYYPTLIAGWRQGWQAIVETEDGEDSITYDIAGVEADSQRQMIRLELHLATAGAVQA